MATLNEVMAKLPETRRAKILARADALILEEATLRQARRSTGKTQAAVAEMLEIGQDSVSRLETRGDMLVSTLRDYVAAIGGKVRLVVEFEGHPPVELTSLGAKRTTAGKEPSSPARKRSKFA